MTLDAHEFMRRFLLHVRPHGFHRIRHYGLFASATRKANIARVRELLAAPEAGRVVPRDPLAIAEAIRALLSDPPDRDAIAATVERFSWPAHAEELDRIYSGLIA